MAGQRGSAVLGPRAFSCGIWDNVPSHLPMKVVVQSSSLVFTLLSILLNVPITRVKRNPAGGGETGREPGRATG